VPARRADPHRRPADGDLPRPRGVRHGASHGENGDRWGVVTDTALLRASEEGAMDEVTAGAIVETPVISVASSDDLGAVAQLMVERAVSHLVVVERHSKRPLGVLSTLDVARALAGFPESHPQR
jgi:CBS domain-containing protein